MSKGKDSFSHAWSTHFPEVSPPELGCFLQDPVTHTLVDRELKRCNDRIEELEKDLDKEVFIANYLKEFISNTGKETHRLKPERPAPAPPVSLHLDFGLDSPIPCPDHEVTHKEKHQVAAYMETDLDNVIIHSSGSRSKLGQNSLGHQKVNNNIIQEDVSMFAASGKDSKLVLEGESKPDKFVTPPVVVGLPVSGTEHLSLARKHSAGSKVNDLNDNKSIKDIFQQQRITYTADLVKNEEIGVSTTQTTNSKSTFSTFKPSGSIRSVQGSNDSMSDSIKSRPFPAARPSLKGPIMKGNLGGEVQEEEPSEMENKKLSTEGRESPNHHDLSRTGSKMGPPVKQKPKSTAHNYMNVDMSTIQKQQMKVAESIKHSPKFTRHNSRDAVTQDAKQTSKQTTERDSQVHRTNTLDCQIPLPKMVPKSVEEQHSKGEVIYQEPDLVNTTQLSKTKVEEPLIYDEPLPVENQRIESCSSSDDDDPEPIYYNLLLVKKQTLTRVSKEANALYASVDMHRQHLENKAKRLSTSGDMTRAMMPIPVDDGVSHGSKSSDGSPRHSRQDTDSVGSISSVFSDHGTDSGVHWKKRPSMFYALDSGDNTSDSTEEMDDTVHNYAETEKLKMRKWVVKSILDSENTYVGVLNKLAEYNQTFKNIVNTPGMRTLITPQDIEVIFFKIPDLHRIHSMFIQQLEPLVDNWTNFTEVAEPFKILALEECDIAKEYLENYHKAVSTIQCCAQDNTFFADIVKEIRVKGKNEKESLEELLHKPVVRFQRNTLVLHDLIKCTPTSHPDYDLLQKTQRITKDFLENFKNPGNTSVTDASRYLSKQGLVVEKSGKSHTRKLRYIFLFNDVIVCTKQKMGGRQRIVYEVKWYVALADLNLEECSKEDHQLAEKQKQEVELLQRRVSELQTKLKSEMKKAKMAEGQRNWSFRGHTTNIEKVRKKLFQEEAQLMLLMPHLALRVLKKSSKETFILLMSSDYERITWRESIVGLQSKIVRGQQMLLNVMDLQNLVNSQKMPKTSVAGTLEREDYEFDEEYFFGVLNITIHRLSGQKGSGRAYCCLEVDNFGHFSLKAKTTTVYGDDKMGTQWNEDFDIDLDGTQTLRLLCYFKGNDKDTLIGKCALELDSEWLRDRYKDETISLEGEEETSVLNIRMKYQSREQTLKRTPSSVQGGVFGVRMDAVCRREATKIPLIVTICVQEVEKRGLEDVGIYRVSGLSSEVKNLKKAFERNSKAGVAVSRDADINVLTGVIKLYFRELPEAVFTDALYNQFIEGVNMSDPEAREKFMLTQLQRLPEPNYTCVLYLLDHLVKVSQNELQNKMSLHNLSTVFGPTLLRPATRDTEPASMEQLFMAGAKDAMMQTGILLFFLNIRARIFDSTEL